MGLILQEVDLGKKAFLAPPMPAMNYTWQELIKLRKGAIVGLLIASALPIALLLAGAYFAFLVLIFDPHHHLSYGTYGLIPGLLFLVVAIKMLLSWLKLLSYTLGLSQISK